MWQSPLFHRSQRFIDQPSTGDDGGTVLSASSTLGIAFLIDKEAISTNPNMAVRDRQDPTDSDAPQASENPNWTIPEPST